MKKHMKCDKYGSLASGLTLLTLSLYCTRHTSVMLVCSRNTEAIVYTHEFVHFMDTIS